MISAILFAVVMSFPTVASVLGVPDGSTVRVRVYTSSDLVSVDFEAATSDSLRITDGGQVVAVLAPGEKATVEQWQGVLRVKWSRGSVPLSFCRIGGASILEVTPKGRPGRRYRGSFEASLDDSAPDELELVNVVDIEDYVASVLPAEYPFKEIEGAKAQAIVIRTYAIASAARNGADHSLRDDAGSQVYLGVDTETDLSRRVARETAGAELLYEGEAIDAVYSSHCGGHTANNEDVWGTKPLPYLRGRKDPYDEDAPVADWSSKARVKDVHKALSTRLGKKVDGFKIEDRGAGKHVVSVKIKYDKDPDETVSGSRFRYLLNSATGEELIKSTIFDVKKKSSEYRFSGHGNGHGVGFCQWGAAAQAREGRDYEKILKFYYKGVDIAEPEPRPETDTETDLLASAEPASEAPPIEAGVAATELQSRTTGSSTAAPPARPAQKRRPGW